MKKVFFGIGCFISLGFAPVGAETPDSCLLREAASAPDTVTLGDLRATCGAQPAAPSGTTPAAPPAAAGDQAAKTASASPDVVGQRLALERYLRNNPYVLTAYRPNYLLPLVYLDSPNQTPFVSQDLRLEHIEMQFQLSLQIIIWNNLLSNKGYLSGAFTDHSFWQAYNRDNSSPLRESDYEPELFYTYESKWKIFGFTNVANQLILNHQSNGDFGEQSRSWNRVMLNGIFEKGDFTFSFKPWYRIPESPKRVPTQANGDDNPDIERYMGYFEWTGSWHRHRNLYSIMLRNNLTRDNKGAVELSWAFPISKKIKAMVRYFNGYGESLLDYNRSIESIGIGFAFSDWL